MALDDVISSASGSGSGLFGSGDGVSGSGEEFLGSGDFYSGSGSGDFMGSGDDIIGSGDYDDEGPLFDDSDDLGLFDDEDIANDVITQLMNAITDGSEADEDQKDPETNNQLNIDMPDEFPMAEQTNAAPVPRGGQKPTAGNRGAGSQPRNTMDMPDSLMDRGKSRTSSSQNSPTSNAEMDMPDEFGVATASVNKRPIAGNPMTSNKEMMQAELQVTTTAANGIEPATMVPDSFANAGETVAVKKSMGPTGNVMTQDELVLQAVSQEMTTAASATESVTMAPIPFANAGEVVAEKKSMGTTGNVMTQDELVMQAVSQEMTTAASATESVTMAPIPFANAGEVVAEKKSMGTTGNVMTQDELVMQAVSQEMTTAASATESVTMAPIPFANAGEVVAEKKSMGPTGNVMTQDDLVMQAVSQKMTTAASATESVTMAPIPFANAGEVVAEKKSVGPRGNVMTQDELVTQAVPQEMTTAASATESVTMAPIPFANAGEVVAEKKSMGTTGNVMTQDELVMQAVSQEMTTAASATESVTMAPIPFANAGEVVAEKKSMGTTGNVMTQDELVMQAVSQEMTTAASATESVTMAPIPFANAGEVVAEKKSMGPTGNVMTQDDLVMQAVSQKMTTAASATESVTMAPIPFANAGEVVAEKKSVGPRGNVMTQDELVTQAVPQEMTTAASATESVTMAPIPFASAGEVVAEKKSMGPTGKVVTQDELVMQAVSQEMTSDAPTTESVTMAPIPFANAGEVVAERKSMGNGITKQEFGVFDPPFGAKEKPSLRPNEVKVYIDPPAKFFDPFMKTTEGPIVDPTVSYPPPTIQQPTSTIAPEQTMASQSPEAAAASTTFGKADEEPLYVPATMPMTPPLMAVNPPVFTEALQTATTTAPVMMMATEYSEEPSHVPAAMPMIPPLMAVNPPVFTEPLQTATTTAPMMMMATEASGEPPYVPAAMPMIPPLMAVNPPVVTEAIQAATTTAPMMMMATEASEEPSYVPAAMPMIPPLMAVNPPVVTEAIQAATTTAPMMMMATEASEEPSHVPAAMPMIPPLMANDPPVFTEAPEEATKAAPVKIMDAGMTAEEGGTTIAKQSVEEVTATNSGPDVMTSAPNLVSEIPKEPTSKEEESSEPITVADNESEKPVIDGSESSKNRGKVIHIDAEIEVRPSM